MTVNGNDNDRYSLHDTYKLKNARTPLILQVALGTLTWPLALHMPMVK